MNQVLHRRIGFELELMAPRGVSRLTLAEDLAGRFGGRVQPVWHHDSEPSLVPGLGRFLHLTQGFEVRLGTGELVCTLVDDVTLLADLDPRAPALPGWHRVLTDDRRLLRLLARYSDPGGPVDTSLDRAAVLWGARVERFGDVLRLDDGGSNTVALAAPQGGERERPCEIVTTPLVVDHAQALEALLGPARELGFGVPREAAVHMHLDGAPFREPAALANVVRLFAHWREPLRILLATNPNCTRLAPLPEELVRACDGTPSYDELQQAAVAAELTKFFDVNLTQLLNDEPFRDTIEIRILPGAIHTEAVLAKATLIEQLLDRCLDPAPFPAPPDDPDEAVAELLRIAASLAPENRVTAPIA